MRKSLLIVTLLMCLSVSCKKDIEVASVTVDKAMVDMETGQTCQLNVQVLPADATDPSVVWTSDNTSVATVTEDGLVTAIGAGEAAVTAAAGLFTSTCTIKVNEKTIPVTSVTLDCTALTLLEGETASLTATVEPDNATERRVTWSSSDESVATVDSRGTVTAKQEGVCAIM
ncbi:MAG: Ig-like domain-containing protein, partial [Bacteroidales bacterium]|nr:Ig-like domain-containing protein [Bacteroidales bacterium]